ncbi:MAG: acyltransferase [Muribaculaceae bacterium]|nr:acyltransferase [Muribaculaceae bacterium]
MNAQLLRPQVSPLLHNENNLDIVRYYLSFAVLFAHFAELTGTTNYFPTSSYTAVGGFFMLSGFLVFYSYLRSKSTLQYFKRRAQRIIPPYMAIVLLCALCGVWLTNLPAEEYFTSSQFWQYLGANLTFANFLQPSLPGVFEGQVYEAVNGSLWTMKVEILLYISIPLAAWLMMRCSQVWALVLIYVLSYIYKMWMGHLYVESGELIYRIMQRQVGGQLLFFYSGVAILMYFDYFQRYIRWLFPVALAVGVASKWVNWFDAIEPLCIAIVIIGFAYNCRWFVWMRKYDNIAYDIYLFHYPIIQLVVYWGLPERNIYWALAVVVAMTISLSLLSWYFIERPVMRRKV